MDKPRLGVLFIQRENATRQEVAGSETSANFVNLRKMFGNVRMAFEQHSDNLRKSSSNLWTALTAFIKKIVRAPFTAAFRTDKKKKQKQKKGNPSLQVNLDVILFTSKNPKLRIQILLTVSHTFSVKLCLEILVLNQHYFEEMLICNPAIIPEFLGSRGRHCRRNRTRNSWQEVSRPDIKMASSCKEISQSPFQFLIELSNASYRKHPIGYPSQQEKTNHSKQFEFFNQKNIKSNPKLIVTCRKHISRAWYGLGLFFIFSCSC